MSWMQLFRETLGHHRLYTVNHDVNLQLGNNEVHL